MENRALSRLKILLKNVGLQLFYTTTEVNNHSIFLEVYKDRIRLIEFFKDYDRHNCGLVTEFQVGKIISVFF
jgi:hypothetical protein